MRNGERLVILIERRPNCDDRRTDGQTHVYCASVASCGKNYIQTRHTASTSMYSLTFCVRVMSPERRHWKPAVQATAVMLRTPPVDSQSPASEPRPLAIYGAQC